MSMRARRHPAGRALPSRALPSEEERLAVAERHEAA
jgi:hypothetical protein